MQYFAPNIDGVFVKERPDVTIDRSHLHKVPFMIGVNSTEMSGMMAPGQDKGFGTGLSEEDGKQATKDALWFMYTVERRFSCLLYDSVAVLNFRFRFYR